MEEIRSYLSHRIQVAGGKYDEVFGPGADSVFASFSSGSPRLLNILADRVLLSAYAKQVRPVSLELLEQKAKVLQLPRGGGTPADGNSGE